MRTRIRFQALAVALLLAASCGGGDGNVSFRLFFDFEPGTVMQLWLYENPVDGLCNPEPMQNPGPWEPTSRDPSGEPITVVYGVNNMELDPGRWGFVFRATNVDIYPDGRDLARGCAVETLRSGPNEAHVEINVIRPFWPGECGDGTLDPEEMCDDSNSVDGDGCSADCLSTPVLTLSRLAEAAQYEPDLAALSGGYMVAYTSDAVDSWEDSTSVNVQRLDESGGNVNIGSWEVLKLNIDTIFNSQEQPRIAMAGSSVVGVWLDFEARTTDGDVRVRQMNVDTGTGAREEYINVTLAGTHLDVVIGGNGSSTPQMVAWSVGGDVFCRLATDGRGVGGSETSCAADTSGTQERPAAAMAPDGRYAVAWAGSGTVYVRFFDSSGAATGAEVAASTTGGTHTDPELAFDADGRLLVAWKEGANVRGRIFAATGAADPADFHIGPGVTNSGDRGIIDVTAGAGRDGVATFIVVWVSGVGVRARLVTGTDSFSINRLIAPPTPWAFVDTGSFRVTPTAFSGIKTASVATTGSGSALVAWEDSSGATTDVRGRVIPMN
jgi:cysteine-rich repeat protein